MVDVQPTFFEGPEKKVELVVKAGHASLRRYKDVWEKVVAASKARILSTLSSDAVDAYLLSESSLFVYDDHLVMITCGRTTLVDAVAEMLRFLDPENVVSLFYERKNEHFPHAQPTSFYDDFKRLSRMLPGRAFLLGDEDSHCVRLFHADLPYRPDPEDTTVEILMHGITPDVAQTFHGLRDQENGAIARTLGLHKILPGFAIDEYAFEPAGYSLNALRGHLYYTVHVTPESLGSYVSFETNVDVRAPGALRALVSQVVSLFQPATFDVIVFEPSGSTVKVEIPPFHPIKHVEQSVCGYTVSFLHMCTQAEQPQPALPLTTAG